MEKLTRRRLKQPHKKRQSIKTLGSRFAYLPDELQTELSLKVAALLHQTTVLPSVGNVEICFHKLRQGYIQKRKEVYRKQTEVEDMREVLRRVNDSEQNSAHQFQDKFKREIHVLNEELLLHRMNNHHLYETLKTRDIELDNEKQKSRGLERQLEQCHIELTTLVRQREELDAALRLMDESKKKLEIPLSNKGEQRYRSNPVLVQTIRTKAAKRKRNAICGLTILGNELFVVHKESKEVEVYDSMKSSFTHQLNLKKLIDPMDIVSCIRNKCLYISDYKCFFGKSKAILRVDPDGNVIKTWSTGVNCGRLSVTDESTVILTSCFKDKLIEYSPDGHLIRELDLSSTAGIRYPLHAIKLTNGHFVVSNCYYGHDLHRLCIVDADGKLRSSFGGKCGSAIAQVIRPVYLSVDGNGYVIVADYVNSRVLLLDSDLEFKREILSNEKYGLQIPQRILLDESTGRLFVADNEWNNQRILIFDL